MRLAVLLSLLLASPAIVADECRVRVASFNVALNFPESGGLAAALATGDHGPARKLAAIIQTVRPDVLLLNEVDHDPDMAGLTLLRDRFLAVGSDDRDGMRYEHTFTAPVNTGVPSGADLDRNGSIGGPGDAFGFGAFPGQYGMAVLSRLPIDVGGARTFQELPWSALPAPAWPIDPETGESWYDDDAKRVLRLSSKSHWDIPVELPGGATLHLLASHPTPPVFDGPEDRNGLRNADEIRFWRYYIDGEPFRDDQDRVGGLAGDSAFIIAGDLNADPLDGASTGQPAGALLDHPRIRATPAPRSEGAVEKALADGGVNRTHRSPAATDTADFGDGQAGNLRVDYVLPSTNLDVLGAGVFWPDAEAPGAAWIDASDHRLVWIDVGCAPRGSAMAAGASYNPRSQE